MRRSLRFVGLLLIAVQLHVFAQAKPDPSPAPKPNFSGTWVFTSAEPGGRGGRGGFNLGLAFTVTQDDKAITVVANTGRGGPVHSTYKLDGSLTSGANGLSASKIEWEGSKLVITTGPNPPRTQTWSLDATGSRMTVVSKLNAPNNIITTTVEYQKK